MTNPSDLISYSCPLPLVLMSVRKSSLSGVFVHISRAFPAGDRSGAVVFPLSSFGSNLPLFGLSVTQACLLWKKGVSSRFLHFLDRVNKTPLGQYLLQKLELIVWFLILCSVLLLPLGRRFCFQVTNFFSKELSVE